MNEHDSECERPALYIHKLCGCADRIMIAEIKQLREVNQELWAALTPEKRHELNLKFSNAHT